MISQSKQTKAQNNKWCRIAICYPNFRNFYTKSTSDLQFVTQNYTQTNKKCEEPLYKINFFIAFVRNFENRLLVITKSAVLQRSVMWLILRFLVHLPRGQVLQDASLSVTIEDLPCNMFLIKTEEFLLVHRAITLLKSPASH
jgi:hypothetical protein